MSIPSISRGFIPTYTGISRLTITHIQKRTMSEFARKTLNPSLESTATSDISNHKIEIHSSKNADEVISLLQKTLDLTNERLTKIENQLKKYEKNQILLGLFLEKEKCNEEAESYNPYKSGHQRFLTRDDR